MELVTLPLWFTVDWCAPVWERHGRSLSFKFMMRLLGNWKNVLTHGILSITRLPQDKCECMWSLCPSVMPQTFVGRVCHLTDFYTGHNRTLSLTCLVSREAWLLWLASSAETLTFLSLAVSLLGRLTVWVPQHPHTFEGGFSTMSGNWCLQHILPQDGGGLISRTADRHTAQAHVFHSVWLLLGEEFKDNLGSNLEIYFFDFKIKI